MKMCDVCGSFPAAIHCVRTVDQHARSLYLCATCAEKQRESPADDHVAVPDDRVPSEDSMCPHCQMSLHEFSRKGQVGCPVCYRSFGDAIDRLLIQAGGSSVYQGKKYRSVLSGDERHAAALPLLCRELDAAVKDEDFERAAVLRDMIQSLNSKEGTCT